VVGDARDAKAPSLGPYRGAPHVDAASRPRVWWQSRAWRRP
jgi:hypothetical protein